MSEPNWPTVKLTDLYAVKDLRRAEVIYRRLKDDTSALKVAFRDEIVTPRLSHINKVTGQENDADFLAYQLIHVFASIA